MSNSFMRRSLPDRTYGVVPSVSAMSQAAKEAPARKSLKDQRVELLTMTLSACRTGKENAGIVQMSLGMLKKDQLTLVEEAIAAVRDYQERYKLMYGDYRQKISSLVMFGNSANHYSPYDHIVIAVTGTFQRAALIAVRKFFRLHPNTGMLINLCTVMDQQGISLTKTNVTLQLRAMMMLNDGHDVSSIFDNPYLSHPKLVRAVHDHPDHLQEVIDLHRKRGSVDSIVEVLNASKAISEGAL